MDNNNPYLQGQPPQEWSQTQETRSYQNTQPYPNAQGEYGVPNYNPYTDFSINETFEPQPKKINGKKIAIIAGSVTFIVALILVVFFVLVKKDVKKTAKEKTDDAKTVAERCMNAYINGDAKTVMECFPREMYSATEWARIEQTVTSYQSLDIYFKITGESTERKLSDEEAEEFLRNSKQLSGIDVTEITEVSVGYELDYMGVNDEGTLELVCGKINNKWYVIDGLY